MSEIKIQHDKDLARACLPATARLAEVVESLKKPSLKIVFILDEKKRLKATITDGDIRRGLLAGKTLDHDAMDFSNPHPLTASPQMRHADYKEIMRDNGINQLPVVDENGVLLNVILLSDLLLPKDITNKIVIMAGGRGQRLYPLTQSRPKPMLMINHKPILEHIIIKAREEGFLEFYISLNYLGDVIKNYFQDGHAWGVHIHYIDESEPLGTAGAIGFIAKDITEPIMVMNGDVLTHIRLSDMLRHHHHMGAAATMAVRRYEMQNPFGVVRTDGFQIAGFQEKPIYQNYVNAGIYVLSPDAAQMIQPMQKKDMPDLFNDLRVLNMKTIIYPMHEAWMDIGTAQDLDIARDENGSSAGGQ